MRPITTRLTKAVMVLAAAEAIFCIFGFISIRRGNPFRLYDGSRLVAEVTANLPNERAATPTGWPARAQERPHPPLETRKCGSAWGGSFTVSADVPDADAWPYLASLKLGCQISNFGVDGFAFDQTLLLFQQSPPHDSLVILGMAQPMITTGGASSWTFLDLEDHLPRARITKPFFTLDHAKLKLEPRPAANVDAILLHYNKDDYSSAWTPLQFPFSLSVIRAIYNKLTRPNLLEFGTMTNMPEVVRQRDLANATIAAMAKAAQDNHDRFVVLLVPRPEDATNPNPAFAAMLDGLAALAPNSCLVDPSRELNLAAASLPDPAAIMTKTKHFSSEGNAALADALVRGIADCEIRP